MSTQKMKSYLLIVLTFLIVFGCTRGPDESIVKNVVRKYALKICSSNFQPVSVWEIENISVTNRYKQKDLFTGFDMFVYEVSVTLKAKHNFVRNFHGQEDVYPSKDIKGKVFGKGTVRHYTGKLGFSKYGKEWRYEVLWLDLMGPYGFRFEEEIVAKVVMEQPTKE